MKKNTSAFNVPVEFMTVDGWCSESMRTAVEGVLIHFKTPDASAKENNVSVVNLVFEIRRIERDFLVFYSESALMSVSEPLMTMGQFDVIAKLMRSKEPARTSAFMVLVLGWSLQSAVKFTGLKTQSVWNAVNRFKIAYDRLIKAFKKDYFQKTPSKIISLTPSQFDAVALLMRSRKPASSAAKLVLVYSQTNAHAAREVGIQPQSCWNTINRFKSALKLIDLHFRKDHD